MTALRIKSYAGVSSKVQEILGHSTLAVTKRYTHVTSQFARDAADRMARVLWRTETVQPS